MQRVGGVSYLPPFHPPLSRCPLLRRYNTRNNALYSALLCSAVQCCALSTCSTLDLLLNYMVWVGLMDMTRGTARMDECTDTYV